MITEITISQFKAHCLEIISKMQNSAESIIITKRHKPVAKIKPINQSDKISIFGIFKDKAEIKGDIINSLDENWDCEK